MSQNVSNSIKQTQEENNANVQQTTSNVDSSTKGKHKGVYLKHYLTVPILFSALVFGFIVLIRPKLTTVIVHEVVGLIILALILVHITLFRNFFSYAYRNRNAYSIYKDSVVSVLLVFFTLSIVTGVMGSKEIFFNIMTDLGLDHEFWKDLHEDISKILINIIAIHIGMYWSSFINWFTDTFSYAYKIKPFIIKYTCSLALLFIGFTGFVLIFNQYLPISLTEEFTLPLKELSRTESNIAKGIYSLSKATFYGVMSYFIASILLMFNTKKAK